MKHFLKLESYFLIVGEHFQFSQHKQLEFYVKYFIRLKCDIL